MSQLAPLICAVAASAVSACAQTPQPRRTTPSFDPALVREQQRRIAAYDSVVRSVNTDSLYTLWHAMLTTADIRATQLLVDCEADRLIYRYGHAASTAIQRMRDTLWRNDSLWQIERMSKRMVGESTPIGRDTCGPTPTARAPRWLREWWVYELPKLPPSPDSAASDP